MVAAARGEVLQRTGRPGEAVLRSPVPLSVPRLQQQPPVRFADAERAAPVALLTPLAQPQRAVERLTEADIGQPRLVEIDAQSS